MKLTKTVIIILSIITASFCLFPIMSTYSGGGESGTLIARGFNLMEFTALGIIPIIAPLLIPIILYGNQNKASKERSLILLFLGNMLSYVHSFNAANDWLENVSDSPIFYYPAIVVYHLCFILVLVIPKAIEAISSLKK